MDIRRRFLSKKSSGGSSGGDSSGTYTVNLNSQWEKTTAVTNPDSSLYDGVYRSSSSYNVNNGVSIMYITLTGYSTFKLYIRSYAESNYDYVMVSQLDKTITGSSSYSDTTLIKAHTRGNQQSGTELSSYTLVEYTGISSGSHTITIVYRKDGSVNNGDDRGYVLIPKSQESGGESGGGDIDIDTTYSIMYTSSDGNVVTPYNKTVFGANITNNVYIKGQGIITFDGPVTSIGENAFRSTTLLTSITIPNSVTSIDTEAFHHCTSLSNVTIPNNVISIGDNAFYDCTSLIRVTIGNRVTSIGSFAFRGCPLTGITIPNSVTSVGTYAFYNNVGNVTVGTGLTSVGTYAFQGQGVLTVNCNIVDANNSASGGWFSGCEFTKITIGNGVSKIGKYAFDDCNLVTRVIIPPSVTEIGSGAFAGNTSLSRVDISDLSAWCRINFGYRDSVPHSTNTQLYLNNQLITDLVIPSDITSIKQYAFSSFKSIKTINVHDNVTSIESYAFEYCDDLDTLTIGSGIRTIGTNIIDCNRNAVDLYCKAVVPPTCSDGDTIFRLMDYDLKVYVPKGSLSAYKSSPAWKYPRSISEYSF